LALQRIKPTSISSKDETANVNFFYDDIVHVLQSTVDSRITFTVNRKPSITTRQQHEAKLT